MNIIWDIQILSALFARLRSSLERDVRNLSFMSNIPLPTLLAVFIHGCPISFVIKGFNPEGNIVPANLFLSTTHRNEQANTTLVVLVCQAAIVFQCPD